MPTSSSAAAKKQRTICYQRPPLYPKQEAAFFAPKDFQGNPARYSWIEASTKAGKTVAGIAWLYEQAYILGGPGKNFWWVAPVFSQAAIAFERLKRFLGMPDGLHDSNNNPMRLFLPNGAIIWFKSADNPDSLYGEDVWAVVMDEASRSRTEAWHAVRSTLTATRGHFRAIGNVKGRRNWFYLLARQAEKGSPNDSYHKITAYDAVAAKVLDQAEIDDAQSKLPEEVFKELYLAEASDDGGNPFGLKFISKIVTPDLSLLPVCGWGWDLAKSRDWTVGVGVDTNGRVCRFERFQKPWEETITLISNEIGGITPTLIDSTGVGDPIVERLQKTHANVEGFKFTSQSKQRIMEGLAVAVQKGETSILEGLHQQEMESFEYEYTRLGVKYTAPEGMTDDAVCAHALAIQCKANDGFDAAMWEKLAA